MILKLTLKVPGEVLMRKVEFELEADSTVSPAVDEQVMVFESGPSLRVVDRYWDHHLRCVIELEPLFLWVEQWDSHLSIWSQDDELNHLFGIEEALRLGGWERIGDYRHDDLHLPSLPTPEAQPEL